MISAIPGRITAAGAIIVTLVFVAAALVYARWGGPLIDAMAESIAEIQMEQGNRFSDAGDHARAIESYQRALAATFTRPENRAATLHRMGYALRAEGRRAEAVDAFRQALDTPGCTVSTWQWLTVALSELGDYAAAQEAAAAWERHATEAGLADFAALARKERERIDRLAAAKPRPPVN